MKRRYSSAFTIPTAEPFKKRIKFSLRQVKQPTAYRKATQALKIAKQVKKEIEVKELVEASSDSLALISTKTWNVILLNAMSRGTDEGERIGRKVTFVSVQVRYQIVTGITANDVDYRISLVYDRYPDGVLATGANIYDANSIIGNINTLDKKMRGRFSVLHDEILRCHLPAEKEIVGTFYVKKNLKTSFTSNNGDITDIDTGALLLCWVKGIADTSTVSTLNYNVKMKYTDS